MKKIIGIILILLTFGIAHAGPMISGGGIPTPVSVANGGTGAATAGAALTSLGAAPNPFSDYQYIPIDAFMRMNVPPASVTEVRGTIGSQLLINGTNAVWIQGATPFNTLTVNANHINLDAIVYSTSGTQTATSSSITLVKNKYYLLVATETHTSGAHIVISGTGGFPTTTLAAGANNIYWRATATATVLTITATTASSNACTFSLKEYTRPVRTSQFTYNAVQSILSRTLNLPDITGLTISIVPVFFISNATAPTVGQTIKMDFSAFTKGNEDVEQALSNPATSTYTAGASAAQYMTVFGSAVTVTPINYKAPAMLAIMADSNVAGTYNQNWDLEGIYWKAVRTLAP
jgi:hypothetical protein